MQRTQADMSSGNVNFSVSGNNFPPHNRSVRNKKFKDTFLKISNIHSRTWGWDGGNGPMTRRAQKWINNGNNRFNRYDNWRKDMYNNYTPTNKSGTPPLGWSYEPLNNKAQTDLNTRRAMTLDYKATILGLRKGQYVDVIITGSDANESVINYTNPFYSKGGIVKVKIPEFQNFSLQNGANIFVQFVVRNSDGSRDTDSKAIKIERAKFKIKFIGNNKSGGQK